MVKRLILLLIAAAVVFTSPLAVFASDIKLDGNFDDWNDKPELSDLQGDEDPEYDVIAVKWFPDMEENKLFLCLERFGSGDKKDDRDKGKDKDKGKNQDEDQDEEDFEEGSVNLNDLFNDVNDIIDDIIKGVFNNNRRFRYWFLSADFSSELGNRKAYILYHPPSRRVFVLLFDISNLYIWSANGKWGENKKTARRIEFYVPLSALVSSTTGGYQVDLSFASGGDRIPDSGTIKISTISTFPWPAAAAAVLLSASGFAALMPRRRKKAEGTQGRKKA